MKLQFKNINLIQRKIKKPGNIKFKNSIVKDKQYFNNKKNKQSQER